MHYKKKPLCLGAGVQLSFEIKSKPAEPNNSEVLQLNFNNY